MAMQVWPSSRRNVACRFWAVVMQEICRVCCDLLRAVFYADVMVLDYEVAVLVVLEALFRVLCEYDVFRLSLILY